MFTGINDTIMRAVAGLQVIKPPDIPAAPAGMAFDGSEYLGHAWAGPIYPTYAQNAKVEAKTQDDAQDSGNWSTAVKATDFPKTYYMGDDGTTGMGWNGAWT